MNVESKLEAEFHATLKQQDIKKTKEREISCLSAKESQHIPSMHWFPFDF
jgi:hypothetical protein